MANISNLALKNHAAATVTFVPEVADPSGTSSWVDRTQGSFAGTARVSLTPKINPDPNGTRKVQLKLTYPTVDATTGVLSYTELFAGEFVLPNRGTKTTRQELYARVKEFIVSSVVSSAVLDGEMPW